MISLFSIAFTNDGGSENKKALSEEYRSCQHWEDTETAT